MEIRKNVALLAEGVDRNRASAGRDVIQSVALLAEGVDRNIAVLLQVAVVNGRPPRGGRG